MPPQRPPPSRADRSERELDPHSARAHALRIRRLQAELLAARGDAQSTAAEAALQAQGAAQAAAAELRQALVEMEQHVALRPRQWAQYCAHALYQLAHEQRALPAAQPFLPPATLEHVLQIHERAAREGTGMDAAAHARYASLLLHWHQAFSGVDVWRVFHDVSAGASAGASDLDMRESAPSSAASGASDSATVDILQELTGLVGGPMLQSTPSGAWIYVAPSLPVVPSRAEVAAAAAHVTDQTAAAPADAETDTPADVEMVQQDHPDMLADYEACLREESVRERLWNTYARFAHDATNSQALFLIYLSFEMAYYHATASPEQRERVLRLFKARVTVTHDQHAQTMSMMSEFVTSHYEPEQYEALMASAASAGAAATAHANRVRSQEDVLHSIFATTTHPLGVESPSDEARAHVTQYIATSTDRTKPAVVQTIALYRRALAILGLPPTLTRAEQQPPTPEYEKKRQPKSPETQAASKAELEAESSLTESVWEDYLAFIAIHNGTVSPEEELDEYTQALRVLPGSGTIWARLMRTQTRLWQGAQEVEAAFQDALAKGQVAKAGVTSLASFLLGRCIAEKQMAITDLAQAQSVPVSEVQLDGAMDTFVRVEEVGQRALTLAKELSGSPRQSSSKAGTDPELRLEKFISGWCERFGPDTALLANDIWDEVANAQRTRSRAQVAAAEYFARTNQIDKARHIYKRSSRLVTEDQTRLLEAWVEFEQMFGMVSDLEYALARTKRETQRAWEQYYASYQAQTQTQAQDQAQAQDEVQGEVQGIESTPAHWDESGRDAGSSSARQGILASSEGQNLSSDSPDNAVPTGSKRTADEAALGAPSSGGATTTFSAKSHDAPVRILPPPKMPDPTATPDRENSSVVVSSSVPEPAPTSSEVRGLFQGCGTISDMVEPRTLESGHWAGMVVFADRSSVPVALTRDQKRITFLKDRPTSSAPVQVAVSRDCTLYVTNFPDVYTDSDIRSLFGQMGDVLDVRWPSRRFSSSRRFCYVEMATAQSASHSLSLNGRQLTELNRLTVALSDPERRKMRSDANASEREVYVTGLPHRMSTDEVRELFTRQADLLAVRVPRPGIAFADFRTALDAHKAQAQLDGMSLQGRSLKATKADPSKKHQQLPHGGQGFRSRAVHVANLPSAAQEALVQQEFERLLGLGTVRKVEYAPGASTAIVELASAQLAGQALLAPRVVYGDTHLILSSLEQGRPGGRKAATKASLASGPSHQPLPETPTAFAPRTMRHRDPAAHSTPKANPPSLDVSLPQADSMDGVTPTVAAPAATDGPPRKSNQDKFRALLQ